MKYKIEGETLTEFSAAKDL